jgi:hypothetical protein
MAPQYIDMNALDEQPYKGSIKRNYDNDLSDTPCLVISFSDGSKLELRLNLVPLPEFNGKKRFLLSVASAGNILEEKIIRHF